MEDSKPTYKKLKNDVEVWYDEKGNAIHLKGPDGKEAWTDYDANGKTIHRKWADGAEQWFDENGNMIHFKNKDGGEAWADANGNPIHLIEADGNETWWDDKRNIIHQKDQDDYEYWYEYDDDGKIIHEKRSNGIELWFNKEGIVLRGIGEDGKEYSSRIIDLLNGKELEQDTFLKTEDIFWYNKKAKNSNTWYYYDYSDNIIQVQRKNEDGSEEWFDADGNLLSKIFPDGREELHVLIPDEDFD